MSDSLRPQRRLGLHRFLQVRCCGVDKPTPAPARRRVRRRDQRARGGGCRDRGERVVGLADGRLPVVLRRAARRRDDPSRQDRRIGCITALAPARGTAPFSSPMARRTKPPARLEARPKVSRTSPRVGLAARSRERRTHTTGGRPPYPNGLLEERDTIFVSRELARGVDAHLPPAGAARRRWKICPPIPAGCRAAPAARSGWPCSRRAANWSNSC